VVINDAETRYMDVLCWRDKPGAVQGSTLQNPISAEKFSDM
jgi:hypothetical protein